MKKPELLCPVGGADSLGAALLGGADAVYFGGREFNARMNAKNMDREQILSAIDRCHEKGVRVYVTLNTLLADRNLEEALDFASFLYGAGCDALILADLGFSQIVRQNFPDFELHASTQMSAHNLGAAEFLKEKGFSRVVLAREMDRENLSLFCRESPIETELFVHGAICASASGQCLMSSMIGDRSGNRGECAQPCRLPYNNGKYLLSFKDLCLASHLSEIASLPVHSIKIEGRMKSPEYVYTVAKTYRTLLDENRPISQKELAYLSEIFSRSGFTDGYFTGKKGPEMLGTRTREDKAKTQSAKVRFSDCKRSAPPIRIEREKRVASLPEKPPKEKPRFHRSARFLSPDSIPDTDFFAEIYLPLEAFRKGRANGVVLPAVIFPKEEEKIRKMLESARENGAEHALVGNVGHLPLLKGLGFHLHGDFRLNVTNSFSLNQFPEMEDLIVSPECLSSQIRDLKGKKCTIVYGKIPVMLLEKDPGVKKLLDRKGIAFSVHPENGRFIVSNSAPFYMADKKKLLKEKGIENQHFIFTDEGKKAVEEIIFAYQKGLPREGNIKRIK